MTFDYKYSISYAIPYVKKKLNDKGMEFIIPKHGFFQKYLNSNTYIL